MDGVSPLARLTCPTFRGWSGETVTTCNTCGHDNEPAANFCSSCGASLSEEETTLAYAIPGHESTAGAGEPDTSSIPSEDDSGSEHGAVDYGVLEVLGGPKKGSRFALSEQTTAAGRHPDSLIFLDDVTVSRRHAVVERVNDDYVVRDAGSLNGTYLNRERVEESILAHGDEVQVGKFKLVFIAPGRSLETDG